MGRKRLNKTKEADTTIENNPIENAILVTKEQALERKRDYVLSSLQEKGIDWRLVFVTAQFQIGYLTQEGATIVGNYASELEANSHFHQLLKGFK